MTHTKDAQRNCINHEIRGSNTWEMISLVKFSLTVIPMQVRLSTKNNEASNFSFSVVAFDKELPLSEFIILGEEFRPLTASEATLVAKEMRESKKSESDCTTVPNYLDSAAPLLSAKVKGTDLSIRLSQYENAGCGGHLAEIFILDVLKAGVLLKKYELLQYRGGV